MVKVYGEFCMSLNIDNNKVKTVRTSNQNNSQASKGSGNYTVKSGETLYSLMKKFNFKNETEIRGYLHLSGTARLQKGQKLTLPTVKVETTMSAIAQKYNMSLKDLMLLNPEIKDSSKVVKGQPVFVPIRPFDKTSTSQPNPTAVATPKKTSRTPSDKIASIQVTPEDIARDLKEAASDFGAVSGEKFINAFSKITSNNVIDVIKAYDKISPKESLIKMICREVSNSKESRKEAVMKIYNMLAQKVGENIATQAIATEFKTELNEQFDSWGLVSTEKLDEIIKNIIKIYATQPVKNNTDNKPKGIYNLADVAKVTGLSENLIVSLKRSEDGSKMKDDEFHTTAYKDKNGNWTIGIGHLITKEEESKYLGRELSVSEVCTLFREDIDKVTKSWQHLLGEKQYKKLPQSMKDALTDYMFNRGYGRLRKQTAFINALKSDDYAKAISLMNVDYSYKKGKNGKLQVVYLTGLSKRRLFDMYLACKMYKGNIPAEVKSAIQNMYNRGVKHMQTEFPDKNERQVVLQNYNNEVKAWFGNLIQYK